MKLTAKSDLEVSAAFVFAALTDHQAWEREAVRNGVDIQRPAGSPDNGVGAQWRIQGHFRGKMRKLTLSVEEMVPNQRLTLSIDSLSIDGTSQVEIMVLSPRRSRVRVDLDLKPKTLAARLFINTMRLAKGRVQVRFERGLGNLCARIKDRYDRQA